MSIQTKAKRFTLTLPASVHTELTKMAKDHGISSKDVVIKCLKLGLIAFDTEDDPSKELILRENSKDNGVKETRLILI